MQLLLSLSLLFCFAHVENNVPSITVLLNTKLSKKTTVQLQIQVFSPWLWLLLLWHPHHVVFCLWHPIRYYRLIFVLLLHSLQKASFTYAVYQQNLNVGTQKFWSWKCLLWCNWYIRKNGQMSQRHSKLIFRTNTTQKWSEFQAA